MKLDRELLPDFAAFVESLGYVYNQGNIELHYDGQVAVIYELTITDEYIEGVLRGHMFVGAYMQKDNPAYKKYRPVKSTTQEGLTYIVSGKRCTCPANIYMHTCKHIHL